MTAHERICEVEDILHEAGVYVSGIDGRITDMGAYMTVTDYSVLVPKLLEIKGNYTSEQWAEMAEHWIWQGYLGPNWYLLGKEVQRTILGVSDDTHGKEDS